VRQYEYWQVMMWKIWSIRNSFHIDGYAVHLYQVIFLKFVATVRTIMTKPLFKILIRGV